MIHFTNHKNSKFGAKKLFSKKIPQARINENDTWRKWRRWRKVFRHSATNATFAILRIQEKGIDFQGKRVLKWISTDFLGMSVNVSARLVNLLILNSRYK